MKRFKKFAIRVGDPILFIIGVVVFITCGSPVRAQIGSATSQTQIQQAVQLPLSGRTGQSGTVTAAQAPVPGVTTSVDTLNPTIQVQGSYSGSINSTSKLPFSGKLSLLEAVQRGIAYNLGVVGITQAVRQAHGQSRIARSELLPNLNGDISETIETVDLAAFGLRFSVPGSPIPAVTGPFNYMDVRVRLSQSVANLTALNNFRSANEIVRANQLSVEDARELVALAVGGAYLQVLAAQARVESGRAQLETANALYDQTTQQFKFGKVPQLDVNRSQVETLTQRQRLLSLQNDASKQKIALARLTGLPPNDQYELSDDVPFSAAASMKVEDALQQAFAQRADLKSAAAQVQAAERAVSAARDERFPSLSVSADYGAIGTNPAQAHGTYTAAATLSVPIWQGGRTAGDIEQADAALTQRRSELEDIKSQIESEVRSAFLDLQAATSQVDVARQNLQVTQDTLAQTRTRLDAGVSNNVELVQAQESLANAQLDYINGVFAHNVAKLSLARAVGRAADGLPQFLNVK